jgi:hypothetical protein
MKEIAVGSDVSLVKKMGLLIYQLSSRSPWDAISVIPKLLLFAQQPQHTR